ncbi:MAG: hypothetical protein K2J77_07220 [Oscillospiraceae bacterium]|nr:hypothetical protein [Oscillospiraceae bacterium]
MADSYLDSFLNGSTTIDEIRQQTYEKYKDKFKDSTEDLVNSDTFLNLLVAEMTNQDPLEPTSNTEFITQLASFSQLNYMRDSSRYAQANYAASLVGKIATATKPNGKDQVTKTGIVESVSKKGDSYNVVIDGEMFDISKVTKVEDPGTSSGTNTVNAENALADSIARASAMILMYVTAKTDDGVAAGWIDSIKVNDGKISAVLVDQDGNTVGTYPLDKLTEITVANIGTDAPNEPGNSTNEPEQSEENKKVDETVGAGGTDDVGT